MIQKAAEEKTLRIVGIMLVGSIPTRSIIEIETKTFYRRIKMSIGINLIKKEIENQIKNLNDEITALQNLSVTTTYATKATAAENQMQGISKGIVALKAVYNLL